MTSLSGTKGTCGCSSVSSSAASSNASSQSNSAFRDLSPSDITQSTAKLRASLVALGSHAAASLAAPFTRCPRVRGHASNQTIHSLTRTPSVTRASVGAFGGKLGHSSYSWHTQPTISPDLSYTAAPASHHTNAVGRRAGLLTQPTAGCCAIHTASSKGLALSRGVDDSASISLFLWRPRRRRTAR